MMLQQRLVVLVSGEGTNLQAIIDACRDGLLPARVVHVISNRGGVGAITRARRAEIPHTVFPWDKQSEKRENYDARLAEIVIRQCPDLIVLAGWMHLLTVGFLRNFYHEQILNLHPALHGDFPGADAIGQAYSAGASGGAMVHTVIAEVDAGRCITQLAVPLIHGEQQHTFKARIGYAEKAVLVCGIANQLAPLVPQLLHRGKVRDVYKRNDDLLLIVTSDRLSSFDREICSVPGKGNILNLLSAWWFAKTQSVVRNHMVKSFHEFGLPAMLVHKCRVFPVEFVVRGYITGTTNTSMWTLYEQGERCFGDNTVPDGLLKHQKLLVPIVTPTSKSDIHDEPLNRRQIIERGLMTSKEYDWCYDNALRLFEVGQRVAEEKGLILADTKYEFGVEEASRLLMLVDEIHTCDSSRYWLKNTYEQRISEGVDPDRYDKDIIRSYVRERCNPYDDDAEIPEIPDALITHVASAYNEFSERLIGSSSNVKASAQMNFRTLALMCRN